MNSNNYNKKVHTLIRKYVQQVPNKSTGTKRKVQTLRGIPRALAKRPPSTHGTRALTLTTHTAGNARRISHHHDRPATKSCDRESLPEESRGGSMVKAVNTCIPQSGLPIHTNKKGHKNPYKRTKNQTHEGPSRRHGRLLLASHDSPPLRTSHRRSAKPEPPEEERGNFSSSGRIRKKKCQKRGKGCRPRLLAFGPQDAMGRGVVLPTVMQRPPRP
ncbi:hypothetical protein Taro_052891 [Colocasia esculenta]|uniref:Uncharacterized protein n=1 Tax=Colocasia esculenta TaxID=4460 RepID=A0A843XJI2_COLES|nr:hypothetical protein [Colocasia esculenta]